MAAPEQSVSTPSDSPTAPAPQATSVGTAPRLDRRDLLASSGALLAGAAAASLPMEAVTAVPAAAAPATASLRFLSIGFLPDGGSRVMPAQRLRPTALGASVQVELYGIAGTIPMPLTVLAHFPASEGGWHSYTAASADASPGSASVPVRFRMPLDADGGLSFSLVAGAADQAVAYPFRLGTGGTPLTAGTYFVAAGEPRTVARVDWGSFQFDRGNPSAGLSQSVLRGGRRGRALASFPHVVFSIGPVPAE